MSVVLKSHNYRLIWNRRVYVYHILFCIDVFSYRLVFLKSYMATALFSKLHWYIVTWSKYSIAITSNNMNQNLRMFRIIFQLEFDKIEKKMRSFVMILIFLVVNQFSNQ